MGVKARQGRSYKIIKSVFLLLGIILAAYMSTLQILRYFENKSTSSITYRKFNNVPSDLYPSFSICVEDEYGGIYNRQYFSVKFGDSSKRVDYQTKLKGESQANMNSSNLNISENIFEMDIESTTNDWRAMLSYYKLTIINGSRTIKNMYGDIWAPDFPNIYLSYQDPLKLCFTRKTIFEKDIIRREDLLWMQRAKSLLSILGPRAKIILYIHPQGQLIRNFDRPVHDFGIYYFTPSDNYMVINIVQVSVLRKRPDGEFPCNPDLNDDDEEFRNLVMQKVGCIPPYWNRLSQSLTISLCNSSAQLQKIYQEIKNFKQVMDQYTPPCSDMSIVSTLHLDYQRTGVRIHYMNYGFEEIINQRDFGFEMFWSSIGGFTGMFLGASLLQIPDFIFRLLRCYK